MQKVFSVLTEIAEKFNANILHGGNVTLEILSDERKKIYLNASEIRAVTLKLTVYGKEQSEILSTLSDFREKVTSMSFVMDLKFSEISGKYFNTGEYAYEQKLSIKYFVKGGE